MRTLERHQVPATLVASGACGQLYPEVLKAAAGAGHAIGGHGWPGHRAMAELALAQPDGAWSYPKRFPGIGP